MAKSEMQPHFNQNIVLTGGNLFPGVIERLKAELRSLVPAHLPCRCCYLQSISPVCYPWEGGKLLAHSPDYDEREDYEENIHIICEENLRLTGFKRRTFSLQMFQNICLILLN